jgi:hypothetical protein
VRLDRERDDDQSPVTPRTYRSDLIEFEGDDKQRLQALQHIDPSFSEVFLVHTLYWLKAIRNMLHLWRPS